MCVQFPYSASFAREQRVPFSSFTHQCCRPSAWRRRGLGDWASPRKPLAWTGSLENHLTAEHSGKTEDTGKTLEHQEVKTYLKAKMLCPRSTMTSLTVSNTNKGGNILACTVLDFSMTRKHQHSRPCERIVGRGVRKCSTQWRVMRIE